MTAADRESLLERLSAAKGARVDARCGSVVLGELSRGCQACREGRWLCVFVTRECGGRCAFCPAPLPDGSDAVRSAFGGELEPALDAMERAGTTGVAYSGGDPLLRLDETLRWAEGVARRHPHVYQWIYTPGVALRDAQVARIAASPLREIRLNLASGRYLDARILRHAEALAAHLTVAVEVPLVPEELPALLAALPSYERAGVRFLNLHEYLRTDGAPGALPYALDGDAVVVVDPRSRPLVRRVMDEVSALGLGLSVNDCSVGVKDLQMRLRRRTMARLSEDAVHTATDDGWLESALVRTPEGLHRVHPDRAPVAREVARASLRLRPPTTLREPPKVISASPVADDDPRFHLDPDVFVIPDGETHIVYAPLAKLAFRVNRAAARLLDGAGEPIPLTGAARSALAPLLDAGLLRRAPFPPAEPRAPEPLGALRPTSATLLLTERCNLACAYCYAAATPAGATMPPEVALATLRLLAECAAAASSRSMTVHIHGGGEATTVMPLLREVVAQARRMAAEAGLLLRLTLGTNGVMSDEAARWVATTFDNVTVSLDGPAEIHDGQRRRAGGGGSHERVLRTLGLFTRLDLRHSLRCTVLPERAADIPAIAGHLFDASPGATVKIEPASPHGRGEATRYSDAEVQAFVVGFQAAARLAQRRGRRISYSGARIESLSAHFCAAPTQSLCVTPRGDVTSCYEVLSPEDPRARDFFFGAYDPARGELDLDPVARARVAALDHPEPSACRRCFCRYHCRGDCPAKRTTAHGDDDPSPRCPINRALSLAQLRDALERAEIIYEAP